MIHVISHGAFGVTDPVLVTKWLVHANSLGHPVGKFNAENTCKIPSCANLFYGYVAM
jgi:hypothetical protein